MFHIARNHPFVDGNKRTALAASLVFLLLNEVEIDASEDDLTDLVLGVAEGRSPNPTLLFF
ncbi:MAG: type II toxin-antitoxin system death-on-curing family toxin [Vicinamibacteria bacterium]